MPGVPSNTDGCPVLKPSKAQFDKPFLKYVSEYFKKNPEVSVVKVVPPKGYKPRRAPYDMDRTVIETPIEQRVLMHGNKPGYYDCVLLSRPSITVKEFEELAQRRGVPKQGHEGDEFLERAFWSSLTVKPPLYGADTPYSLFDEDVASGWNLRKLGCLLDKYNVPDIPGVTTPMTYFGMWKSFFSWHVEDVDLLSINYLHFGASKEDGNSGQLGSYAAMVLPLWQDYGTSADNQGTSADNQGGSQGTSRIFADMVLLAMRTVWYAVAPGKDRKRFEELAKGLFPKDAAKCANFLRHKTIMITPQMLKKHGIPYVKVKHNPGEFIVLNAGAYHAGYNQGFNCAEAVNFATEDWIPLGKEATRCDCKALGKDAVRVDMRVFPGGAESSSDEESCSHGASEGDSRMSDADSMEDEGSSNQKKRGRKAGKAQGSQNGAEKVVGKRGPGRPRKHPPAAESPHKTASSNGIKNVGKAGDGGVDQAVLRDQRQAARHANHANLATLRDQQQAARHADHANHASHAEVAEERMRAAEAGEAMEVDTAGAGMRRKVRRRGHVDAVMGDAHTGLGSEARQHAGHGVTGLNEEAGQQHLPNKKRKTRQDAQDTSTEDRLGSRSKRRRGPEKVKRPVGRPRRHPDVPQAPHDIPAEAQWPGQAEVRVGGQPSSGLRAEQDLKGSIGVVGKPYVIVGRDEENNNRKFFYLVQKMDIPAKKVREVRVRWLEEGPDGLYYPSNTFFDENSAALMEVRTQECAGQTGRRGIRLLTLRSKILDVELSE